MCQFSPHPSRPTLKDYIDQPDVYPAGRLDWDSEGLLVLTSDGGLQHRITDPSAKLPKTYWVQVEGVPDEPAMRLLRSRIDLGDFVTRPADVRRIDQPALLWPRDPPIRFRRDIPTSWLQITLREGKNRQVRRMTAAAGFPTLRLIRAQVGTWTVDGLRPGEHRSPSTQAS